MIRFAAAVTAIEIALTIAAALWVSLAEAPEPYLSRAELRALGFEADAHSTERKQRFGAVFSYDTRASLAERPGALYVSLRVGTPPEEYRARRGGEILLSGEPARGVTTVLDSDREGVRSYSVRHRGPDGIRAEVVFLRGSEMLIVRATRPDVPGGPGNAASAACERAARIVQHYMLRKLGWA